MIKNKLCDPKRWLSNVSTAIPKKNTKMIGQNCGAYNAQKNIIIGAMFGIKACKVMGNIGKWLMIMYSKIHSAGKIRMAIFMKYILFIIKTIYEILLSSTYLFDI